MARRTSICGIILASALVTACDREAVTTVVVERSITVVVERSITVVVERSITVAGSPTALQTFRQSVATAAPRRLDTDRMQADVSVPANASRASVVEIVRKAGNLDLDYSTRETRTVTTSPSWHAGFDTQPQRF